MKKDIFLSGCLLIVASIIFWISWFLMPDPGTTDTYHILAIVKHSRTQVISSVVSQIVSSVLFAIALVLLARITGEQRQAFIGIALWSIGAMGMCADAFFHLLAWFMTDDAVNRNEDVVRVMEFMQTGGVYFLIPLMLPFFLGGPLLARTLYKQSFISKKPVLLFGAAFIIGVAGVLIDRMFELNLPNLVLTPLTVFVVGLILTGYDLVKAAKKETRLVYDTFLRPDR